MLRVSLPAGFAVHDDGRMRVVAPRYELEEMVALLCGRGRDCAGEPVAGGRGGTRRVRLPGGKTVYLRKCLRGGLVRWFVRDLYWLRPERPLQELVVVEHARAAGCRLPAVVAVATEEVGPFYRGWVVSEEVPGARPLIDELASAADRVAVLGRVSAAIERLHGAGVYHVDLTGDNVLVDGDGRIWLVDFDRAFLAPANASKWCARGRARLWRSLVKLAAERSLELSEEAKRAVLGKSFEDAVPAGAAVFRRKT
ncbi:MAG: hypothetical protein D6760_11810 [Deltaproteobacteria bacterium]|nr:MAG: hypothetical protein D6760_11810 [Deltaproteobacteria bacterium]